MMTSNERSLRIWRSGRIPRRGRTVTLYGNGMALTRAPRSGFAQRGWRCRCPYELNGPRTWPIMLPRLCAVTVASPRRPVVPGPGGPR